ncbi:MAG: GNAT family N-acetyltransferase [Dehalococcoidales bacterium]|jgi:mycothiol synthase
MSGNYAIRNFRNEDFTEYLKLLALNERLQPSGRCITADEVVAELKRPGYSPEQALFVAEFGDQLVGYLDVELERLIGRAILTCWLAPQYRRFGLAEGLIEQATIRARELEASIVQMRVSDARQSWKKLVIRLGFEFVRSFPKLSVGLAGRSQNVDSDGTGFSDLSLVGLEGLVNIQNRAFAGAWGYCPNTLAEISYRFSANHNSPQDIIIASEESKVVGYCWTKPSCGSGRLEGIGRIFMLGVDPEYQGRCLGRKLLMAGLAYLENQGLKAAWLEVDGENKDALRLYRSLGFRRYASTSWYQKSVG